MEEIFIELQIAIQEGSDLDLKNEDCHVLNNYIDSKLSKIKDLEKANKSLKICGNCNHENYDESGMYCKHQSICINHNHWKKSV